MINKESWCVWDTRWKPLCSSIRRLPPSRVACQHNRLQFPWIPILSHSCRQVKSSFTLPSISSIFLKPIWEIDKAHFLAQSEWYFTRFIDITLIFQNCWESKVHFQLLPFCQTYWISFENLCSYTCVDLDHLQQRNIRNYLQCHWILNMWMFENPLLQNLASHRRIKYSFNWWCYHTILVIIWRWTPSNGFAPAWSCSQSAWSEPKLYVVWLQVCVCESSVVIMG